MFNKFSSITILLLACLGEGENLPYLAHSFNHPALILNLIKQGAIYHKVDLQRGEFEQCNKLSKHQYTRRYREVYDVDIGCFALVGDLSSVPYFKNPIETEIDLFRMLRSQQLKTHLE